MSDTWFWAGDGQNTTEGKQRVHSHVGSACKSAVWIDVQCKVSAFHVQMVSHVVRQHRDIQCKPPSAVVLWLLGWRILCISGIWLQTIHWHLCTGIPFCLWKPCTTIRCVYVTVYWLLAWSIYLQAKQPNTSGLYRGSRDTCFSLLWSGKSLWAGYMLLYKTDSEAPSAAQHSADAVAMYSCSSDDTEVSYSLLCDFRQDCANISDESFCYHPPCTGFTCTNGQCVSLTKHCNNLVDWLYLQGRRKRLWSLDMSWSVPLPRFHCVCPCWPHVWRLAPVSAAWRRVAVWHDLSCTMFVLRSRFPVSSAFLRSPLPPAPLCGRPGIRDDANNSHIVRLSIARCSISALPDMKFPNMLFLNLCYTKTTSIVINVFNEMQNLQLLVLKWNPLKSMTTNPSSLFFSLKHMDLSGTHVGVFDSKALSWASITIHQYIFFSAKQSLDPQGFQMASHLK